MDAIRNFLKKLQDGEKDVERCIEFLLNLQRTSKPDSPAPILEIISIIKFQYPKLFDRLKERTVNHRSLQFLMEVSIDYSTAKKRLGIDG